MNRFLAALVFLLFFGASVAFMVIAVYEKEVNGRAIAILSAIGYFIFSLFAHDNLAREVNRTHKDTTDGG